MIPLLIPPRDTFPRRVEFQSGDFVIKDSLNEVELQIESKKMRGNDKWLEINDEWIGITDKSLTENSVR